MVKENSHPFARPHKSPLNFDPVRRLLGPLTWPFSGHAEDIKTGNCCSVLYIDLGVTSVF